MHPEARAFIAQAIAGRTFGRVVEFGSLNINGSVRDLFVTESYLGLDIQPGNGVDLVTDAALWIPDESVDAVVCCEVFEHTAHWPQIIASAHRALRPKGLFVCTAAGPGRQKHSAVDGGDLRPGEHYANIGPHELGQTLHAAGFTSIDVTLQGHDVQAVACA